ncbi:unnamed protein product [Caenorhabditis auriculariae]|uniref:NADH-rubredoxin oxidoreductase C-terminal domain-containing protein n=1 Tax=Caenorhabditis auriculariae TaxID=2777116 RepID=A0A8S1HCY6_9PELO|nr:unnamed protein product [Caenorhabditis auriculariae]
MLSHAEQVVLLGDYKPERQEKGSWRIVERIVDDEQYVRCVVVEHKVVGAMLIGETDLEETMENLILNKTNIAHVEEVFLDPDVDIDDYFD